MKKSSSFHAFSTELPTLIEVEEQLAEHLFDYSQHYYLNNPHNQPVYHLPHHQHHSMPPPMAYPPPQNGNNHMTNQFTYHNSSGSYGSLQHTQFNDFNDPNNKNKLTNSLSVNNINQYSSMQNSLQGNRIRL